MTAETLIKCLEIAKKYSSYVAAEHDVVYFGGPELETSIDGKVLDALGAFKDEYDSWAAFV